MAIALANWTHLSPATKALFGVQAQFAMMWWPQDTLELVRRLRVLAPMRDALAGSPGLRTEFDLAWTFRR